jgi:hypothetical protein
VRLGVWTCVPFCMAGGSDRYCKFRRRFLAAVALSVLYGNLRSVWAGGGVALSVALLELQAKFLTLPLLSVPCFVPLPASPAPQKSGPSVPNSAMSRLARDSPRQSDESGHTSDSRAGDAEVGPLGVGMATRATYRQVRGGHPG